MIECYFSENEIAQELDIPMDAVKDLLAGNMEINKADVDKLLNRLEEKLNRWLNTKNEGLFNPIIPLS